MKIKFLPKYFCIYCNFFQFTLRKYRNINLFAPSVQKLFLLSYFFFLAGWLSRNIYQINIFVWSIVHRSTHRCARRYWLAQPIGELRANFHQWESSESLSGRHTSVMQLAKEKIRYQSKIIQQYSIWKTIIKCRQ